MLKFNSQTYGTLDLPEVIRQIADYIGNIPQAEYRIVIGTDSQPKNSHRVDFVSAIVVHRVGNGGIYFWYRTVEQKSFYLRERMYKEADFSLKLARKFIDYLQLDDFNDLEIHVDIGRKGETRDMIGEIVNLVRGQGFKVKTKPEAFAAASVADRHA